MSRRMLIEIDLRAYIHIELNTPAVLELVPRCHLGPRTCKIEIWHPELVKLCHLGPYHLMWRHVA